MKIDAQRRHHRQAAEARGRTTPLHEARWSRGYTQAELAQQAHVGLATLQGIEGGRSRGSSRTWAKLALALGVEVEALR